MAPQAKNGNGVWLRRAITVAVIGLLSTAIGWGAKEIHGNLSTRVKENTEKNAVQDTSIARINTRNALRDQTLNAMNKNIQVIMDYMEIPTVKRTYVDSLPERRDTTDGR